MKTKEEIKEHLLKVPYTIQARNEIMGYLIGAGYKTNAEIWSCICRGEQRDWSYFWNWLNKKDDKQILKDIMSDLVRLYTKYGDKSERAQCSERIDFLMRLYKDYDEE